MHLRIQSALLLFLFGIVAFAAAREAVVVTSFYPVYVSTLNVVRGVPDIVVRNLASPPEGCLHDYQLTPGDLRVLGEADVLVVNGAGMEPFVDRLAGNLPRLRILDASQGLDLPARGAACCEEVVHDHHGPDPHVWMTVRGYQGQVLGIAQGLAAVYPDRADAFLANAAAYNARLEALHGRLAASLSALPRRRVILFHESFVPFAREYGLDVVAIIEAEAGRSPSAARVAEVVRTALESGAHAVLAEPHQVGSAARIVAREAGLPLAVLDAVTSGPSDPELARDAYLAAMEHNLGTLATLLR